MFNDICRLLGINASTRRVGGLRFVKLGRLCVSWSVTREYRSMAAPGV
jgi:hypothetical protein